MGEVVAGEKPHVLIEDSKAKKFVQKIYLGVDEKEENLIISCYPTDTTGQAKVFYELINENKVNKLREKGWSLYTVLHFSYIGTHLVYAARDNEGTRDPLSYIKYWKKEHEAEKIRQYKENEIDMLVKKLIEDKMISKLGEEKIKREFVDTKRDHINLAPGIKFSFTIPLEKAIKLDNKDKLVSEKRQYCNGIFNLRKE